MSPSSDRRGDRAAIVILSAAVAGLFLTLGGLPHGWHGWLLTAAVTFGLAPFVALAAIDLGWCWVRLTDGMRRPAPPEGEA